MISRKTYLTVIVGAIVALTPPMLVYLQGRVELQMKYRESNAEANAGYQALVDSVSELRVTVRAQHDALTRMQGYLDGIRAMAPGLRMSAPPPPIPKPEFHELPASLDAAQMKR